MLPARVAGVEADVMTDEFDDVDRSHDPYISSLKARAEIRRLAGENGLAFTHNPGGGQFYGNGINCQITTYDDVEDLAKLRKAIANKMKP